MSYNYETNYVRETKEDFKVSYKETVELINTYKCEDWAERCLRKETLERFGVKMTFSETDGPMGGPTAVYFPYYDKGKVVGYKKKNVLVDKKTKGHWEVIGRVGVESELFGSHIARKSAKKVYVSEGEVDMLSLYQVIVDKAKALDEQNNTNYSKLTPVVVSISSGTPNAKMNIAHNKDFIDRYKEVILCFDNDYRHPSEKNNVVRGKEATEEVASLFTSDNVYTLPLPDYINDINEMVQKGKADQLACLALFDCKKYLPEQIISVEDISLESIIKPKEKGIYIQSFPILMNKLWGIRRGETNVFTSMSGTGKTSCLTTIAYELGLESQKIGMIYLEETYEQTIKRIIAQYLGVNYNSFKFSPTKYATKEKIQEALNWVKGKFYFYKEGFNTSRYKNLMNTVSYLTHVIGCEYIILDHIGMLLTGGDGKDDERRFIDEIMTEVVSFGVKNNVGIELVSHLNRKSQEEFGKISDIKEPKWIAVRKEHMRGAASLEQLAFAVIGLDFQFLPNKERGNVRWSILKNREIGLTGNCDVFSLDDQTGKVILVGDSY